MKLGEREKVGGIPSARCAIYARVSTEKQVKQNISIPDQIARARVYAEMQGWEVVTEFIEFGASAWDDTKRPQFRQMIADALSSTHPFDIILVHSFSRFYRDQAKSELVRRDLKKKRVQVRSLSQEIVDDGGGGTLALSVMGLIDEYQSRESSKHVRRAMEANARAGFRSGGNTPFGYQLIIAEMRGQRPKHKLGIDPIEAQIVRDIFDHHQHGLGIKKITQRLNEEGFKTRKGGKWYTSTVADVLTNETYMGKNFFKGRDPVTGEQKPREEWIEMPCAAIVSEAVFRSVQEQLAARAPNITAPRITTSPVLLGGIAHCASCDRHLQLSTGTGSSGTVYRYYKCAGKVIHGACDGGDPISIPETRLDDLVIEALTERLMTPERIRSIVSEVFQRRTVERGSATDRVKGLRNQLAKVKRDEKNLWNVAIELGLKSANGFKEKLLELEEEKSSLAQHIATQESLLADAIRPLEYEEAVQAASKMRHMTANADIDVRRRYVRSFVAKVVVSNDEVQIFGQYSTLAEAASGLDISADQTANRVRGFEREWLPGPDSNRRPFD